MKLVQLSNVLLDFTGAMEGGICVGSVSKIHARGSCPAIYMPNWDARYKWESLHMNDNQIAEWYTAWKESLAIAEGIGHGEKCKAKTRSRL